MKIFCLYFCLLLDFIHKSQFMYNVELYDSSLKSCFDLVKYFVFYLLWLYEGYPSISKYKRCNLQHKLGCNLIFLSMIQFEQELSKYLVSKFSLIFNIKPWGMYSPCLLLLYITMGCIQCAQKSMGLPVIWTNTYFSTMFS